MVGWQGELPFWTLGSRWGWHRARSSSAREARDLTAMACLTPPDPTSRARYDARNTPLIRRSRTRGDVGRAAPSVPYGRRQGAPRDQPSGRDMYGSPPSNFVRRASHENRPHDARARAHRVAKTPLFYRSPFQPGSVPGASSLPALGSPRTGTEAAVVAATTVLQRRCAAGRPLTRRSAASTLA